MSHFKAKMHQNRFRLRLRPRPRWCSLQRSPIPLAVFKGPTSKAKEGEGEKKKGEGKGGGERPYTPTVANSWLRHWSNTQKVSDTLDSKPIHSKWVLRTLLVLTQIATCSFCRWPSRYKCRDTICRKRYRITRIPGKCNKSTINVVFPNWNQTHNIVEHDQNFTNTPIPQL